MKKELICICCPLGCGITVEIKDSEVLNVSGNTCQRGYDYAVKEISNPTRTVTGTVHIRDGEEDMLPVKTKEAVPKAKVIDCAQALKAVIVEAPVKAGDIVLGNVCDTGIDVVATKNIDRRSIC